MATTASVLICEGVTENADGTVDVKRAGMSFWDVPKFPGKISITLLIRVPALPLGKHEGSLRVKHPDGEDLVKMTMDVTTTEPMFAVPHVELLPKSIGVVTFEFSVAGMVASEKLTIRQLKATKAA